MSENKTTLKKNNKELDKYLFIYEDKDKNKKIYAFQKNHGEKYDLRCKALNCSGRVQYEV